MKNLFKCSALIFAMAFSFNAKAVEILFAYVGNGYLADGANISSKVDALSGFNVTEVNLSTDLLGDLSGYDQIWVYDLTTGANNNATQTAGYTAIADWYNGLASTDQNLIADGRIISSADSWIDRPTNPGLPYETDWIQNYALQLDARGGGLVLGTDHAEAFTDGINTINSLIGIDDFTGYYYSTPLQAVVDTSSPLYISTLGACPFDASLSCINDNSSTSYVATGLQANGQYLTPVAWHGSISTAFDNAAVSSTMGSITFPVPEPTSIVLLCLGIMGLCSSRRRV